VAFEPFEKPLDIIGSFNKTKFKRVDSARTVNLYPVIYNKLGESSLFSFPGYKKKSELQGQKGTRASFNLGDRVIFVCGNGVFTMNEALVTAQIGTLTTFSGHVGIAANASGQVIFVDGAFGYIYENNVFTKITAPAFPALPVSVVFLDGFFYVAKGNSPTFYQSAPNNGNSWDSMNFASITTKPDIIVAMAVLNRRLFIFGKEITETWYNAGRPTVAVARDNNLILPYGCACADSVEVDYGLMFFMAAQSGGPNQIMMTDGTEPRKVSNPNMENEISNYIKPSDASANLCKFEGQLFYILSFTTDQHTWVYNFNTGGDDWAEAEQLPGTRHIMQAHIYFKNKHYIGSYLDGNIYELSDKYYDNDGTTFRRQRVTPRLYDPRYRKITIDRLEVDCLKGNGSAFGEDEEPLLFLYVSTDGGITFKACLSETTGEIGKYSRRVIFRTLGSAYDFVFKFEYFNRTEFALIGAVIKGTVSDR